MAGHVGSQHLQEIIRVTPQQGAATEAYPGGMGRKQVIRLDGSERINIVRLQGEIRHDRFTDKEGVERFFSKVVVSLPGHEVKSLDRPEHNPADED